MPDGLRRDRIRRVGRGWCCFGVALALALVAATLAPAAAAELTLLAHEPSQPSAHPPLIVLLHGSSADERDMIGMWRDLPPDFVVVSPRAPFPDGGGFRWYRKSGGAPRKDDLALSRKIIDLVVDESLKRFHADPRRVFIGGFSQGAVMTYAVALSEPGRFRGAVALSGAMLGSANASAGADRSHESFFVGHGTADKRIPFAAAISARETLARLGVPAAFHAYAGMGHETGAAELHDLGAWVRARAADSPSQ